VAAEVAADWSSSTSRLPVAAGGGPARTPARRLTARGGSVGDKNLQSKVFRPSERNGGVSFVKKWPQSRVSRVAALKL